MYRILDLDNCLADDAWRIPKINWAKRGNARYHEYHLLCGFDRPANLHLVHHIGTNVILTGRPTMVAGITEEWLRRNAIPFAHLLTRPNDNHMPSAELKAWMLLQLEFHYDISREQIEVAYDDHLEVIRMYREFGVPAVQHFVHEVSAYVNPNTMELVP